MIKISVLAFALIFSFAAGTVFAGNCNNDNFPGTYTRVDPPTDVLGNGSVLNQHVFTLTLGSDGSARQDWTGYPDYMLNVGSGTSAIGSWKCRSDGKLVVTLLAASFFPVAADPNVGTIDDIALAGHLRITILFNVNNPNKLTRIQSRTRSYGPGEDPTNPTGGTLRALVNSQIVYNRLVANDSDLTAP